MGNVIRILQRHEILVTGVVSLLNHFVFLYLFRPQSDINEGQLMDFPFASPQF